MNQSVLFLILCMMSLIQPVAAAQTVGDVSTNLFFTLIHRLIPLQSLNRQTKKKKKHILNIIFHIQNKNNHIMNVMQTIENSPNLLCNIYYNWKLIHLICSFFFSFLSLFLKNNTDNCHSFNYFYVPHLFLCWTWLLCTSSTGTIKQLYN